MTLDLDMAHDLADTPDASMNMKHTHKLSSLSTLFQPTVMQPPQSEQPPVPTISSSSSVAVASTTVLQPHIPNLLLHHENFDNDDDTTTTTSTTNNHFNQNNNNHNHNATTPSTLELPQLPIPIDHYNDNNTNIEMTFQQKQQEQQSYDDHNDGGIVHHADDDSNHSNNYLNHQHQNINNHHNNTYTTISSPISTTTTTTTSNIFHSNKIMKKFYKDTYYTILFCGTMILCIIIPMYISFHTTNTKTTPNDHDTTTTVIIQSQYHMIYTISIYTWIISILWMILMIRYIIYRLIYPTTTTIVMTSSSTSNTTTTATNTNHDAIRLKIAYMMTTLIPICSIILYGSMTIYILFSHTLKRHNNNNNIFISIVFILVPLILYVLYNVYMIQQYILRKSILYSMGYISRITFFHIIMNMSFHIICRSFSLQQHRHHNTTTSSSNIKIKRISLFRIYLILVCIQVGIIFCWRRSFIGINILVSYQTTSMIRYLLLTMVYISGYWICSCIRYMITYIFTSIILYWTIEQQEQIIQQQQQQSSYGASNGSNNHRSEHDQNNIDMIQQQPTNHTNNKTSTLSDAYMSVDESVYQSVYYNDHHDIMNDDIYHDDEDDDLLEDETEMLSPSSFFTTTRNSNNKYNRIPNPSAISSSSISNNNITISSIVYNACTISLGSIIHCAIFGDLSQCIYQIIPQKLLSSYMNEVYPITTNNHQMSIDTDYQYNTSRSNNRKMQFWYDRIVRYMYNILIHNRSDYGITHVAIYSKNFIRASQDVTQLLHTSGTYSTEEEGKKSLVHLHLQYNYAKQTPNIFSMSCESKFYIAGIEPIYHEDMTSYLCASLSGIISCIVVFITTFWLFHYQNKHFLSDGMHISDRQVIETMLLSYILSNNLIRTVLEPIRASIMASYIAFAQCPECFLHTYPLVYHRLRRLSTETTSSTNGSFN